MQKPSWFLLALIPGLGLLALLILGNSFLRIAFVTLGLVNAVLVVSLMLPGKPVPNMLLLIYFA